MLTVGDVMTTSVVTVNQSRPLKEVAEILIERGISGVPVVDDPGDVVGVVSEADFLFKESGPEARRQRPFGRLFGDSKAMAARQQKLSATTAGEAMTSPPITVRPAQTIVEAARLMTGHLVNRLVVMDGDDLVGIVTRADLVRAFVRTDEELVKAIREEVLLRIMWLDPAGFPGSRRPRYGEHHRPCPAALYGRSDRERRRDGPGIVAVKAEITWSLDDAQVQPATVDAFFPYSPR
jgi:CBS domain-containing protein